MKREDLINYTLSEQKYHRLSQEELEKQEVDKAARKDVYTNLFRLADRGASGSNDMLFWQFILQFYKYCLETTGDNRFIDEPDSETLERVEDFAQTAGCKEFRLVFNSSVVGNDDRPGERERDADKPRLTEDDAKGIVEEFLQSIVNEGKN